MMNRYSRSYYPGCRNGLVFLLFVVWFTLPGITGLQLAEAPGTGTTAVAPEAICLKQQSPGIPTLYGNTAGGWQHPETGTRSQSPPLILLAENHEGDEEKKVRQIAPGKCVSCGNRAYPPLSRQLTHLPDRSLFGDYTLLLLSTVVFLH